MAKSRFSIARKEIIQYFDNLPRKVFMKDHIQAILTEQKNEWRLAQNYWSEDFITDLKKSCFLKKAKFTSDSKDVTRYFWREVSLEDIMVGIVKNGYLSHYSALLYHGLTEQIPKTFYVSHELSPKPKSEYQLTQEGISKAFLKPTRTSSNVFAYGNNNVVLLSSKNTELLGVSNRDNKPYIPYLGELPHVTNLERTLIDISVRPSYSGGVSEVVKAFSKAAERVSINKLMAMLKKLDYVYPFHQCIGFYMSRAKGYTTKQLELVRKNPMKFDFYLTHGVDKNQLDYSEDWKLFFPRWL